MAKGLIHDEIDTGAFHFFDNASWLRVSCNERATKPIFEACSGKRLAGRTSQLTKRHDSGKWCRAVTFDDGTGPKSPIDELGRRSNPDIGRQQNRHQKFHRECSP
ncbi:MAG: hypothetical protein ACK5NY_08015 [Burkholderiaceae bacterium]